MCGRTCLTLDPHQIVCACRYKPRFPESDSCEPQQEEAKKDIGGQEPPADKSSATVKFEQKKVLPEWRSVYNCGRKFTPSYNIAPTDVTPVLVSGVHFSDGRNVADSEPEPRRCLVPMMWGMIPFWHKGDYRKHGLSTNNCRLENLMESKLYKGPFSRGQRCVVLCESFYEWETTKSAKPSERAVHSLYMPQEGNVKIYDKTSWTPDNVNLLKMAGLFDVWQDESGDKILSYSVITFESTGIMSWLHHRMPAILETDQQVEDWLDFKRVSEKQALAALRPATQLLSHRVTNLVNNSRHKSDQCNKPIELAKIKPKNNTLLSWLNVRKRREEQLAKSSEQSDDKSSSDNSASDSERNPPKRPRFSDYKRAQKALVNVSTDSASEKLQTCDDSSSKSNGNDKN